MKNPRSRDRKPRTAYMCGVAWQHEVGETECELFASAEACEKSMGCTRDCGIVEVRVSLRRWVKEQKPISEWRRK